MNLIKMTADHPDIPKVIQLYNDAFPETERLVPMEGWVAALEKQPIDLIAIYPEEAVDSFAGFFLTLRWDKFVYLNYFATCPEMRSTGIGSKAASALRDYYGDIPILFTYESIYVECDNLEQRKRRRNFYLKNGYYEPGWGVKYNGVDFIVGCSQKDFDKDSYIRMMEMMLAGAPDVVKDLEKPVLYRLDD